MVRPGAFQNPHSGEILARIFDRGVNNWAGTLPELVLERDWRESSIGVSTIMVGPLQNPCSGGLLVGMFDRGVKN